MTAERGEGEGRTADQSVRRIVHDVGNDLAAIRLRADLVSRTLSRTLDNAALEQAHEDLLQILDATNHAMSQVETLASSPEGDRA